MSVRIKILSDLDAKGLKDAQAGLEKLKDVNDRVFRALAVGAGVAAAGIIKFGNDSIKAASNLAESTNAVNVAFGKSAQSVLKIGENSAKSLGLAQNEFNQAAVRFSAFAERIVGAGQDTSGFIQEITTRAADFASVFNIEVAEALQVFQSGLAGEAEPLKRFGINLLESEVAAYALRTGIIGVGESMTEAQKVQARYGLLLESTAKTAGDFANTSDGLANSQRILRAQFADMQAQIGTALLPAFTELVKAVGDALMPRLEELGKFLNSPDGKKAIQDAANAVLNLGTAFLDNIDNIVRFGGVLLALTGGVKAVQGALALARTAQLLFNLAVSTNPYVLAVTALVALATTMAAFAGNSDKAKLSAQSQSYQVKILQTEIDRLNDSYRVGAIDQQTYDHQLQVLTQQMNAAKISTEGTAGEIRRFNQLRLDNAIASMEAFKLATSLAERQARSFSDSYAYLESIGAVTRKAGEVSTAANSFASGVASTGPSEFEQARKRVQDLIKSSQKQLQDAQDRYNDSVKTARANYADNVLRIEKDFATRLSNIIQQSQDRLRNAYRSAVETNIAALFNQQESKSVEGLVKSLSDRLAASRQLLANSAQLASQGFSQTFIEQIVGAGTTTGNELASAILNSTPEAQAELKSLFAALETEAATGMDALAKEIYDKQGLATLELKALYEQTGVELNDALAEQQRILATALEDAATTLYDSIVEIRKNFDEEIDKMGGKLGGMAKTIAQFRASLGSLESDAMSKGFSAATMPGGSLTQSEAATTAASNLGRAAGILIDSVSDVDNVVNYLDDRIANAERYLRSANLTETQRSSALETLSTLSATRSQVASSGEGAVGTVININVRADTSQSLAMVGRNLGNTVAKYVTGGGQVIVSPV